MKRFFWLRTLRLAAAFLAGATGLFAAATPKTAMSPFRVEAEFGVDGLRIQNSNSVLNSYLLEQHGVAQFQDLTGIAPNLSISNSDSRGFGDILTLRGISNSLFFSSPGVALYVDDVPGGSVSSYPTSLLNLDTLAVKAGPQGTDYGRNAPGGVIDIKTREPGGSHQGRLQAEYGSHNLLAFQAALDGPINERAGYSAALSHSEREGYIDNLILGRTADDRRSLAGRAALYLKPGDDLRLRFGALFEKIEDDAPRLSSLLSPLSSTREVDPFVVYSNLNGETQIDRLQLSFQARKKFHWGSLIATTARQEFDLDPALTDLDLSPVPFASSRVLQNEEVWSQEFRVESTPRANKAQWRAGLFLSDSDTDGDATRVFDVPPGPFVPPGFIQTERTTFSIEQKTLAAYASADHPLASNLLLKIGIRAEHSDSEIDRAKVASNNFGFPSPQDPHLARGEDGEYYSGSAGLVFSASDSISVQARTSLAYKPKGFSAFTANPALARFAREEQWASEIGVTFGPPQGRFGGSVLGFWNVIDDYQFERTVPGSTDFIVVNADAVTTRGFEAKFMFSPIERIWWDFQAGYTDAKFDDHRDASGARVDGQRVPFVPEYTLRTGVTVEVGRGFSVNASYAAVGRTCYDERNTPMFAQKSYGLVNAQLRYRFERCAIAVYGHNLFEEDYYQFINPEIFAASPGAPRRFGVQLTFEY